MSEGQLSLLETIVGTFDAPIFAERHQQSDVVDEAFLEAFGDFLKLHHTLSTSYLDKTRFEAAIERILRGLGRSAVRPRSRTHRGHDIDVDGVRWSVKTHGDKTIKPNAIFISKFMELGGGKWGRTNLADIRGLLDQFLRHLEGYDRIFQLRYFLTLDADESAGWHKYELVEIPKILLLESTSGVLQWSKRSKTNPRCAYCTVRDQQGEIKFRLYFDGGGERKLQIKDLQKRHCVVHASWRFASSGLASGDAAWRSRRTRA